MKNGLLSLWFELFISRCHVIYFEKKKIWFRVHIILPIFKPVLRMLHQFGSLGTFKVVLTALVVRQSTLFKVKEELMLSESLLFQVTIALIKKKYMYVILIPHYSTNFENWFEKVPSVFLWGPWKMAKNALDVGQ